MATVVNKRQHRLLEGAVLLMPGENTVDDEVWSNANVKGSQLEQWQKLNWVGVKRSLPVSKESTEPGTSSATGGAIPTQPQGYNPPGGTSVFDPAEGQGDESKRSRRPSR